jgi:hypothetical protein
VGVAGCVFGVAAGVELNEESREALAPQP